MKKFNILNVFVCAIDASKAFDKVNRSKLWLELLKSVDKPIVKLLINYYDQSQSFVQNNLDISSIFITTIGVKQMW